ncbi:UDP-N-acetylmuramate dehydrogenase [Salinifilum aidingensis]
MRRVMGRRLPLADVPPSTSGAENLSRTTAPPDAAAEKRPLAEFTTLRLGGPARSLLSADSAEALVEAVRAADAAGSPLLVLGGGSNVVVADAGFDGRVVRIATRGRECTELGDGRVLLTVEAGEDWDDVVADAVRRGLGGVECLSGIPGLTGATPVQNVGAYGVEIADVLESVDLFDRTTGQVRTVPAGELGLAYRSSSLKPGAGERGGRAVVLRVRLVLTADGLSAPIRYPELARAVEAEPGQRVPVAEVREAVLALRRGKGMVLDPGDHDTWSAGSFFTNPIVAEAELPAVLARIERTVDGQRVPQFPAGAATKLSAAWLIEHAGFGKGHAGPGERVRLSTKHTLALTNRGAATTDDLLRLAREVRDGVTAAFGVSLAPEPVLVGCSL